MQEAWRCISWSQELQPQRNGAFCAPAIFHLQNPPSWQETNEFLHGVSSIKEALQLHRSETRQVLFAVAASNCFHVSKLCAFEARKAPELSGADLAEACACQGLRRQEKSWSVFFLEAGLGPSSKFSLSLSASLVYAVCLAGEARFVVRFWGCSRGVLYWSPQWCGTWCIMPPVCLRALYLRTLGPCNWGHHKEGAYWRWGCMRLYDLCESGVFPNARFWGWRKTPAKSVAAAHCTQCISM